MRQEVTPLERNTDTRRFAFTIGDTWEKTLRSALSIQRAELERKRLAPRVTIFRGRDGLWWATWGGLRGA